MVTLYCVSLPPQLYTQTGWYCIPITAIAAFTFFGVDAIGKEIENPFGYDANVSIKNRLACGEHSQH